MTNKIVSLLICNILITLSAIAGNNCNHKKLRIPLLSVCVYLDIPKHVHVQSEQYEEGTICFISFPHGERLILSEGSLMSLPQDSYEGNVRSDNNKKIKEGKYDNVFWRVDIYKHTFGRLRIYYDNVSSKEKSKFDKILDEIKIRKI